MMRISLPGAVFLAGAIGAMLVGDGPARAGANLAFCMQRGGSTECYYATYEQCAAAASGTGGDCIVNPDSAARNSEPERPQRRSRRH
jgi:hypothetical protein